MEANQNHNIYGPERHGRREKDPQADGREIWNPNLEGGPENPGALEDIIGDGLHEALASNGLIDTSTARTIARALAHGLNGEAPHLDAFAKADEVDRNGIESEYFELLDAPDLPDAVRIWIDWLATYLLYRSHPDRTRPLTLPIAAAEIPSMLVHDVCDLDGEEVSLYRPVGLLEAGQVLMIDRLRELLNFYGDAMRAFLSLPDVNAADSSILDHFRDLYVGSYESVEDAMYGLSDLHEWNAELEEWAERRGLGDMVSIDMQQLELRVRDVYDVVELKERLYAFSR